MTVALTFNSPLLLVTVYSTALSATTSTLPLILETVYGNLVAFFIAVPLASATSVTSYVPTDKLLSVILPALFAYSNANTFLLEEAFPFKS